MAATASASPSSLLTFWPSSPNSTASSSGYSFSPRLACPSSHLQPGMHCSSCPSHASPCSTSYRVGSSSSVTPRWRLYCHRLHRSPRSMAPDEEKMTRRSPLDFPIEWERPRPGRRPDIFPQFSPMKTPLPQPPPTDPPEEDEEEEEKKEEEKPEEEPDAPPKET